MRIQTAFLLSLSFLLLTSSSALDLSEEQPVLEVSVPTLDQVLSRHPKLLLHFHAPWCSLCKSVVSELAKVAENQKIKAKTIRIAEIDAVKHSLSAQKFEISEFPTLLYIENGVGKKYTGGFSANEILDWVLTLQEETLLVLDSVEAVETYAKSGNFSAVLFAPVDSEASKIVKIVENSSPLRRIAISPSEASIRHWNLESPTLVLFDSPDNLTASFSGPWTESKISQFLSKNRVSLIQKWDERVANYVFAEKNPILFVFRAEAVSGMYEEMVRTVARTEEMRVCFADLHSFLNSPLTDLLGVEQMRQPNALLVQVSGHQILKYKYPDPTLTSSGLTSFLHSWTSNTLPLYWKSEDFLLRSGPKLEGNVQTITGKTLETLVGKGEKNVVLWVYLPNKMQETRFLEVAESFQNRTDLVFLQINGWKNEIPQFNQTQFPALFVYPKKVPKAIHYTEKLEKSDIVAFLNATFPPQDDNH